MSRHTPGPWGLRRSETGPWAVFDANGNWAAVTTKKQWPAEDLANARLIAAAPDLLEALIALTSPICSEVEDAEAHALARAAIAKATGATP